MISPEEFLHEQDKKLTAKIFTDTPFRKWFDRLHAQGLDEVCDYVCDATFPQISRGSLPKMRDIACEKFDVTEFKLFTTRNYEREMQLFGYGKPAVLIPDSLLEADEEILQARLYAQAAAISAGHHKLKFFIWAAENMSGIAGLPLVGQALTALLYEWNRVRQFSLDRAVLLATGDFSLTLRNILYGVVQDDLLRNFKFGTDDDDFLAQTRRYFEHDEPTEYVGEIFGWFSDYSWLPRRYKELRDFYDGRACGEDSLRENF